MYFINFTLLTKKVYLSIKSKSIRSAISTPGQHQECDLQHTLYLQNEALLPYLPMLRNERVTVAGVGTRGYSYSIDLLGPCRILEKPKINNLIFELIILYKTKITSHRKPAGVKISVVSVRVLTSMRVTIFRLKPH